jgi:hypothetical protein
MAEKRYGEVQEERKCKGGDVDRGQRSGPSTPSPAWYPLLLLPAPLLRLVLVYYTNSHNSFTTNGSYFMLCLLYLVNTK